MSLEISHYTEVLNQLEDLKIDILSINTSIELIQFQTEIMKKHMQKKHQWVKGIIPSKRTRTDLLLGTDQTGAQK